jgi:hypothetical protein
MVILATAVTVGLQVTANREDPEPGIKSMALVEDVQVS